MLQRLGVSSALSALLRVVLKKSRPALSGEAASFPFRLFLSLDHLSNFKKKEDQRECYGNITPVFFKLGYPWSRAMTDNYG